MTALLPARGLLGSPCILQQTGLNRIPHIPLNDRQFRHLVHYPGALRIHPADAPAGAGVLEISLPVPYPLADI
ncbi:MAG: hypothetical protein EBX37_10475 [Alphaproteobacteria bacterium]|nr:hypothetical protein [Alphaproteobacteria bacterium]